LALLRQLKEEFHIALLMITHDLSIVAELADRVMVMYAGKVVERASVKELFTNPIHPYTRALLKAIPRIDFTSDDQSHVFQPLGGNVPDLMNLPKGCTFHPRCPLMDEICRKTYPDPVFFNGEHGVACYKVKELVNSAIY
jgi:oligopeptide/dipeptide ABC transporter ATP-binding protein